MEKGHRVNWRNVVSISIGLLVILADQLSKWWIRSHLAMGQSLFDFGFFRIVRLGNTGAAFGIFHDQSFILTIVAFTGIVAVLLLAFFWRGRWPFLESKLAMSAVGLAVGGALGNLIDRLRPGLGYITDFIDFKVWPAFNVADSAITVGVIILVYCILRSPQAADS